MPEQLQQLLNQLEEANNTINKLCQKNNVANQALRDIQQIPVIQQVNCREDLQQREPKVDTPTQFFGNKEQTETFLAQLSIYFILQESRFPDDHSKTLFAISYMKGMAFNWALPYLNSDHGMLYDYNQFIEIFKITFGDVNWPQQAARESLELKQGCRSVVSYIADFQRLALELNWSNSAPLLDMFDKGLNREIKQALCNY